MSIVTAKAKSIGSVGRHHLPVRATLYMVAAVGCFSVQDALFKWLATDYGAAQLVFFGRILAVPLAVYLAMRSGGLQQVRTYRPGKHLLRIAITAADMLMFVAALRLLPLADAIAIGFAASLFMTALSVPLLRERVGPRRWAAVIVGFVGVLVVLQPSGAGFGLGSILALGSALSYALILILSRQLATTESMAGLMLWNSAGIVLIMAVLMIPEWRTPSADDAWIWMASAVTGAAAQFLITQAFRTGEISLLAPIHYTTLLWATAFGYLVFGDVPTIAVIAGAGIIIGAAVYIVHREAVLARRRRFDLLTTGQQDAPSATERPTSWISSG